MKNSGRVVGVGPGVVSVTVDGNAGASVAACCTVPTVILEAKNPRGLAFQPGELVEVTDGLGAMALGVAGFLVLPAVLYAVGTTLWDLWWVGVLAVVVGIALAFLVFKSLKLEQFPRVVDRVGPAAEESIETEKESL